MTDEDYKEFKKTLRTNINANSPLSVNLNKTDSITLRDTNFDSISFENNQWNLELIDKNRKTIDIKDIEEIRFENCYFQGTPNITADNIWSIQFDNCDFDTILSIEKSILSDSNKNKKVYFESCNFSSITLGSIQHIKYNLHVKLAHFEFKTCIIEELKIENIEIASKFYINKQYDGIEKSCTITKLIINNVIFKENFKLHNCVVDQVNIKDTDFEKKADFYRSHFKSGLKDDTDKEQTEIYFSSLNFKDLTLFGDTKFDEKFHLNYVTIEGFSHFRKAKFEKGLNLDHVNIQNEMNFFNVQKLNETKSKNNTSRETYRIIKHNFEKIGNKIEANKYHALELERYRKDIWNGIKNNFLYDKKEPSSLLDGIVSFFHWISSNHSTNWLLVLVWIFIVGLLTTLGIDSNDDTSNLHDYFLLNKGEIFKYMKLVHFGHDTFIFIGDYSNHELDFKDNIIMFFNKISLGYLYYQFLLSIRKDTRK